MHPAENSSPTDDSDTCDHDPYAIALELMQHAVLTRYTAAINGSSRTVSGFHDANVLDNMHQLQLLRENI